MAATLKVIEGADIGKSFGLGTTAVVIGRTDDSTICLKSDTSISRKHASIQNTAGHWSVTDSGSANGTYINGNRLDPSATAPLKSGDHIRVGDTVLRIEYQSS